MFIVVVAGEHISYLVSSYPTKALAEKAASFAALFSTDELEVISRETQRERILEAMSKAFGLSK